jgi:hypothetical protein
MTRSISPADALALQVQSLARLVVRVAGFAVSCYVRGVVGAMLVVAGVFAFTDQIASLKEARAAVEACFTTGGALMALLFALTFCVLSAPQLWRSVLEACKAGEVAAAAAGEIVRPPSRTATSTARAWRTLVVVGCAVGYAWLLRDLPVVAWFVLVAPVGVAAWYLTRFTTGCERSHVVFVQGDGRRPVVLQAPEALPIPDAGPSVGSSVTPQRQGRRE